ncbi:MAG TPA: UTP--glucose-1-phosphate uridylyltransferase [Spirochaetia bacterium]
MRAWSIGEVARMLGVKPHVIRYWEAELPLLSPKKGLSGRREYTAREVRLLLRFRHFLYERKFTVEGAKQRMWEELGAEDPDVKARFAEIRSDLIEALMTVRRDQGVTQHEDEEMTEKDVREKLETMDQAHLLAHWSSRPRAMKEKLIEDVAVLDPGLVDRLRAGLGGSGAAATAAGAPSPSAGAPGSIVGSAPIGASGGTAGNAAAPAAEDPRPAPYVSLAESRADAAAREAGEQEIRLGRTALLTVAGGQGSRLGYDGPKGMFPVTPIRKLTLFALFAEKLLAARRRYGAPIPWLIMTSPQNRDATEEYFESQDWFGLGRDTVRMFVQGSFPSLTADGRLLLALDGGILTNPNGHGGVIEALRSSGCLDDMERRGVRHLFYFQVDNPLVRVPDPVFLGFHCQRGSQISSKVIEKAYPEEKLGTIVTRAGTPSIIEYSDLPRPLMQARGPDGRLLFPQGSIAIHILDVEFLSGAGLALPLHVAHKKIHTLNPIDGGAETRDMEAVKMEMFVFDAIPLAEKALFFETDRAEEFAPLKNREGLDSIATCRAGQIEQAARWLAACGVDVPRDRDGKPAHAIEISPLFAMDPTVLAARRGSLKDRIDEDTLLV